MKLWVVSISLNKFLVESTKVALDWVNVIGVFWFKYWNVKSLPFCYPDANEAVDKFGIFDLKNVSAAFWTSVNESIFMSKLSIIVYLLHV